MKLHGSRLRLSASDLANHLGCHHLTNLNRLVATGSLKAPPWCDPSMEVMLGASEMEKGPIDGSLPSLMSTAHDSRAFWWHWMSQGFGKGNLR